ncbi:hypothetical protein PNEG_03246 [Pneumocystis murina B123]|uniref:Uncharacterized protein n=1 Tax=Pneumocystis murina (strain B123) TaxID=1069680 RepID=M7P3J3_PNEMU|nr:hypothetical protein PNEG_03246 [Pneumocystis murina B123]EMR08410.1 hypothetical protein PNEG_03246 [Pneumocystis murina B123]
MEDEDEIDRRSLKEIWKRRKHPRKEEKGHWFYGIHCQTENTELYKLAASLKSKTLVNTEEKYNHEELYSPERFMHEKQCGDMFKENFSLSYESKSPKKTSNKSKRSFFWLPEIKGLKKEKQNHTLEYDLKTSNPPTFIDMYGTISENNIKIPHPLNPVEQPIKNVYQEKSELPEKQRISKNISSISKTDFLLSKLLDCFSKQPKILETKGTQTSKYSTPTTEMNHTYQTYTQTSSSIDSHISSQIFVDARETFMPSPVEEINLYKPKRENIRKKDEENPRGYSGIHCLCQKISLRRTLFPPSVSPCKLYTIKNMGNYEPQRCYESKYINYPFRRKMQISPKNITPSQSSIYSFTPFMKTRIPPTEISQKNVSPNFIIKKELSSPFSYEAKADYSTLQYLELLSNEEDYINNDSKCIKKKSIIDESLGMKFKNEINQDKKALFSKKVDLSLTNDNIINYQNPENDLFDISELENKINSMLSALSTENKSNILTRLQEKAVSKNNLESILRDEKPLGKMENIKKNAMSKQISSNHTKSDIFSEANFEKKGKVRIPSIFLNKNKSSPLQPISKTPGLTVSSQNIKITQDICPKITSSSKNISKKENSRPQDSIITNIEKNNNNQTHVPMEKETDSFLFKSYTKKEHQKSSSPATNLDRQKLATIQDINSRKNKSSPLALKNTSMSQLYKKSSNTYSSITHNTSTFDSENFSKNNQIPLKKSVKSFNTGCKVIIPPVFLLEKDNDVNNNNILKESVSLNRLPSDSALNSTLLNRKNSESYNKKANNYHQKFKLDNFNESKKISSLPDIKRSFIENICPQSKLTSKNNQNKSDHSSTSSSFYCKQEYKNDSKIGFTSSGLKKTRVDSKIDIPTNFSDISTKTKDVFGDKSPRHKYLVSAYQEAINISTISSKTTKINELNRTQPNKIIIPSIFTMS